MKVLVKKGLYEKIADEKYKLLEQGEVPDSIVLTTRAEVGELFDSSIPHMDPDFPQFGKREEWISDFIKRSSKEPKRDYLLGLPVWYEESEE